MNPINKRIAQRPSPSGFTLVELLVVITIIGAIAGLSIPAIGIVMKSVRRSAMKAELTNIEGAIDNYYTKYGDYPPDFSEWNIVKRHYLKIFPDVASSELTLLYRLCDDLADDDANRLTATTSFSPAVMDRAEVLVWSLGGFSSDPQYPFTGAGGPLALLDPNGDRTDPMNVEYNPTRNSPEIEFQPERLSIATPAGTAARTYANRYSSDDDDDTINLMDPFPNYSLREGASPIVYFDSRTYAYNATAAVPSPAGFNGYVRMTSDGALGFDGVRPVFSANPGFVPTPPATYGSASAALTGWQFENPQTYQLLAPGLDGLFGDMTDNDSNAIPNDAVPVYFQSNGNMVVANAAGTVPALPVPNGLLHPSVSRFDVTGVSAALSKSDNPFRDNMANFISGTFEDQLP
ncbi:type II secretion system GspH family protein [Stieleria sp. TO1_6]|uniref:type II secretion system protein n=1 Tax=Stieleria tagensis TaxID=2956795 RepID=UPI00209B981C|nr:type II secretion system protein [Stieleria tagensis]MCO8123644.1 type II secretion system GspH family protein [Stieleria tagensis]